MTFYRTLQISPRFPTKTRASIIHVRGTITRAFAAWVPLAGVVPWAGLCPVPFGEQKVSTVAWDLSRMFPGSTLHPSAVRPGDRLRRTQPLPASGLPGPQLGQTSAPRGFIPSTRDSKSVRASPAGRPRLPPSMSPWVLCQGSAPPGPSLAVLSPWAEPPRLGACGEHRLRS